MSSLLVGRWGLWKSTSSSCSSSFIRGSRNPHFDCSAAVIVHFLWVSIPPVQRPSLMQRWAWAGIVNVRDCLIACCVHEGEIGKGEPAQLLQEFFFFLMRRKKKKKRKEKNLSFTLSRPGVVLRGSCFQCITNATR